MPETYERAHTYERVVDGQVVERVQPILGDYEDTRLGLLALEGTGWRVVDQPDYQELIDTARQTGYAAVDELADRDAAPSTQEPDLPAGPARKKR